MEETRETLVVWGSFEYSLVEMAFVVGQGVISLLGRCRGWKVSGQGMISLPGEGFWAGGDKSQIDASGLEHQGGT